MITDFLNRLAHVTFLDMAITLVVIIVLLAVGQYIFYKFNDS